MPDPLRWLVLAALCLGLALAVLAVATWALLAWRFRDRWDRKDERHRLVSAPSRPHAQAVGLAVALLDVALYLALDG